MWKWIVGAVLVVIVVLAGTCYYAVKKFGESGNSTQVAIGARQERVFSAMADADSMAAWMPPGAITLHGHGQFKPGDTLEVSSGKRPEDSIGWIVTEVKAPYLVVLEVRGDSSNRAGLLRRDSLATVGDSTIVTSTFTSPAMDSLRAARGDTSSRGSFFERAFTSLMRVIAEGQLQRLKAHIEGTPLPAK